MKFIKLCLILLNSMGLFLLVACDNQQAKTENTGTKTETIAQEEHSEDDGHDHSDDEKEGKHSEDDGHDHSDEHSEDDGHDHSDGEKEGEHSHGGQVVESGQYHLEFLAEPSEDGTNLDFYLEKGEKHEHISDAQVKAQIQLPNGEQKSIPLIYEADEKHYHGILKEKVSGEYQVVVLSEIEGEKVNGRFSFQR